MILKCTSPDTGKNPISDPTRSLYDWQLEQSKGNQSEVNTKNIKTHKKLVDREFPPSKSIKKRYDP